MMVKDAKIVKIDGRMLRNMIIGGANKLGANKGRINALNVFPVPDGDTGTNMSLTAYAAAKEVEKLDTEDIFLVSKAAASGALRGGRGNSGVIFSQLFRGFSKAIEAMKVKSIGAGEFAAALKQGSKTAYKAVMRPQEGTMLTVARHMAEVAEKWTKGGKSGGYSRDMEGFALDILEEGKAILQKTPDMLPVLKQAGVVDSGGEGLVVFFAGAIEAMGTANQKVAEINDGHEEEVSFGALANFSAEEITFGYCTEFFINIAGFTERAEDALKAYLETKGDSIALVADDEIVKVHVHTDNPGKVMEHAMTIGPLSHLKIENMRLQHSEATGGGWHEDGPVATAEQKEVGIVAVASGAGFKQIFAELGVDFVLEGGQTMNPSAEDIAHGVSQVNAKSVIILPNNKNIVLAAGQAVYLCEDKEVIVVEAKTMPQGINALLNYDAEAGLAENANAMKDCLNDIATGQITLAVRDTTMDGQEVREGDFIGILGGKIVCAHQELDIAAKEIISIMMADEPDVLTVYIGADMEQEQAANNSLAAYIRDNFDGIELDIAVGGQAVYHYIFSAE